MNHLLQNYLNDEEAMLLAKHYTELLEKFEQSALYQFTKAEVKSYKNAYRFVDVNKR